MSDGGPKNHGLTLEDADRLIERTVTFPGVDDVFQRLRPLTDFRKDDDCARVLYVCRRIKADSLELMGDNNHDGEDEDNLYVLKCKVQAPSLLAQGLKTPIEGPSDHTKAELKALEVFTKSNSTSLPHLLAWKTAVQGSDGPMPGGYIAYVVMTLMPGQHLMDLKFWSMEEEEREEIRKAFIPVLKYIWGSGFEPYDTALRNILWQRKTQRLSIIDFEHWHPATIDPVNMDETEELQRWGIKHRPPLNGGQAWKEWFRLEALAQQRGTRRPIDTNR